MAPDIIQRKSCMTDRRRHSRRSNAMIPDRPWAAGKLINRDRPDRQDANRHIDTILNQKGEDVVLRSNVAIVKKSSLWVGQRGDRAAVSAAGPRLHRGVGRQRLGPAALSILAPYTGAAIAEYFMYRGKAPWWSTWTTSPSSAPGLTARLVAACCAAARA